MKLNDTDTPIDNTNPEMLAASAMMIIAALVAMGAWFAQSDTLLETIIQAGLAWCY